MVKRINITLQNLMPITCTYLTLCDSDKKIFPKDRHAKGKYLLKFGNGININNAVANSSQPK